MVRYKKVLIRNVDKINQWLLENNYCGEDRVCRYLEKTNEVSYDNILIDISKLNTFQRGEGHPYNLKKYARFLMEVFYKLNLVNYAQFIFYCNRSDDNPYYNAQLIIYFFPKELYENEPCLSCGYFYNGILVVTGEYQAYVKTEPSYIVYDDSYDCDYGEIETLITSDYTYYEKPPEVDYYIEKKSRKHDLVYEFYEGITPQSQSPPL